MSHRTTLYLTALWFAVSLAVTLLALAAPTIAQTDMQDAHPLFYPLLLVWLIRLFGDKNFAG